MSRRHTVLALLALLAALLLIPAAGSAGNPSSVTIAGSLQGELGCPGDWQPDCAATHLAYDANDDVWQGTFVVPAGSYEYKAALNDSWDENYGLHAVPGGANVPLAAPGTAVKFYFDAKSHWVTDSKGSTIAVAPGSFQSELGCSGDWDPGCLRSWLQDVDGDGVYTFETTALPAGSYDAKVALNEGWDENYGAGGVPGGANIPFTVPADNAKVSFSYVAATHVLSILAGHAHDGNVEWDGLRHDSRSTLYRAPGGAVPAGTPVLLRFRTFHDDVTGVKLRLYDVNASAQRIVPMTLVAPDVSCYQTSLAAESCDYWQAAVPAGAPNNYWYRFIVSDGAKTAYYGDDTSALDGGAGAPSEEQIDRSWALVAYDPAFTTPSWAADAVIYQIFPDRFRNGDPKNDPKTGQARYDEPVVRYPWSHLPEGYCRGYDLPTGSCTESPRGRDYMGGDLQGVLDELGYLKTLGVNTIYFNPIFDAKSNHRYDTADYTAIDRALGSLGLFRQLAKAAEARGIRIVLDGVFNHMSSDSPFFDRYHHYAETGACESLASPWRSWFDFTTAHVPCTTGDYVGWFGFDSIPQLHKANPAVQAYFLTGDDAISTLWLKRGASGWRLDVMGDASFPSGYWETFRTVVKQAAPNALIVGELWQKDTTLLRFLRGDRADSTMNYRLRDAVLGLLTPTGFDSKGFGDSGHPLAPSQFASRIASIQEDYPTGVAFSLMNLLDSHDTARLLWDLTPGAANPANREQNTANVAAGKQRQRLASLIQFTLPGAPTIYYGDEVGMTGADDPDNRRTYPWADTGGHPDAALYEHYRSLAALRSAVPALRRGDLRVLAADDAAGVVAYGRRRADSAALVVVNRSGSPQALDVPVAGFVPDGTSLHTAWGGGGNVVVSGGTAHVAVGALAGVVLSASGDFTPPAAPAGLHAEEGNAQVSLSWSAVAGAASYRVYVSPVTGGGYVLAGTTAGTSFTVTGLRNAQVQYFVVRAADADGNESADSGEVSAMPHLSIGWANLQWPPSLTHTISAVDRTDAVYGQVWIDGVTNQPGATPGLRAQLGYGPDGSNPDGNAAWRWLDASFNVDAGNNDEFVASLLPDAVGTYDYAYRYSTTNGREWTYADLDGIGNGYSAAQAGALQVLASADTTAPATPTGLHVVSASPVGVELAWTAVAGDPSLYGYEILRDGSLAGTVTGTSFVDADVVEGQTYSYAVRSVDTSFNRSPASAPVSATAELRTVTLVVNVTVPASTDGTGRTVHIAGFLDRLDGGYPQWDPGATQLTRVDATHWTITFTGKEGTQLEYKYTLGDWDHVEKDDLCGEIGNRQLTLTYGATGTQTASDTVQNWRNVAPCGN
jgi:glycosidase